MLDELGKILFSLTQVTAKKPSNGSARQAQNEEPAVLLLLRPLEQKLVEAFLPPSRPYDNPQRNIIFTSSDRYREVADEALNKCKKVSADLSGPNGTTHWQQRYEDELECRIAYTRIKEIGIVRWEEFKSDVLLIRHNLEEGSGHGADYSCQLKLACAYLHGVARFAFLNSNCEQLSAEVRQGYCLDGCLSDEPSIADRRVSKSYSINNHEPMPDDEYALIPLPTAIDVRLSCELAAGFSQEYWRTLSSYKEYSIFDVLFMCKDDRGWFWVLTRSQLDYLRSSWGNKTQKLTRALGMFRFNRAGIINHLERTECLTEEVFDFTQEAFICTLVGYRLEDTRDVSGDFEEFEKSLPGVDSSSYFYFRITSREHHEAFKNPRQGALVALFRFNRDLSAAGRLQRMSLVRQLIERWRAKIDSSDKVISVFSKIIRPFQEKTARSAIMSRNFSHNVGSHSLGNPGIHRSIGIERDGGSVQTVIEHRLSTFHAYTQGRLDFLARAISESDSRPEPIFFLNDVLESGFFRQGVLLDTLIEDLGFSASEIIFQVSIQKAGESGGPGFATYSWKKSKHRFVRNPDSDIEDAVVGIPGGMIGAHALYAFLENILRNTVKYGRKLHGGCGDQTNKQDNKLRIYLRLEQCKGLRGGEPEDAWVLSLWDNVSCDCDIQVARQIRQHINEPLVDEKGRMQAQGHGIQEMKICAELLAGGENCLRFPADNGYESADPRSKHCTESCNARQEYLDYRQLSREEPINKPEALRCYSTPHSTGENVQRQSKAARWLTYNLFMPIPVLLGIVPLGIKVAPPHLPPHIRYYSSLQELAERGAYIGILLDGDGSGINAALKEVARLHPCLPFRLMVVTDQAASWAKAFERRNRNGYPFEYPDEIPNRRLHICDEAIGQDLKALLVEPGGSTEVKFLGAGGRENRWDAIVLRAYDAWLRVYKRLPDQAKGQWKLCIGFMHGGETVVGRWRQRLHAFKGDNGVGPCVGIFVTSKVDEASSENWNITRDSLKQEAEKDRSREFGDKFFLLFDNHGEALSFKGDACGYAKGVRFYQKIGLKDGLTLFQSLESPPNSAFGFALFVYSLVEGALTRIAILDERVAQSTTDNKDHLFGVEQHRYQIAEIYPLFTFRREGHTPVRVSARIEILAEKTKNWWGDSDEAEKKWRELWEESNAEGLHFGVDCKINTVVNLDDFGYESLCVEQLKDIDVLVVHEGVADQLGGKIWNADDTRTLFSTAPFLVRTSGRGSESRHLKNVLPFLEFTELSSNTYQNFNKPGLIKAIFSASGNVNALSEDKPL
ncbi:MAG: hypothetical protein PHO08_05975 [Methylococcales bacterium]|nr:hypothetical protein [Methylococcales bacterium]